MTKPPNGIDILRQALEFLDALGAQIADSPDYDRMKMDRYGMLVPVYKQTWPAFENLPPEEQLVFKSEEGYLGAIQSSWKEKQRSQLTAVATCMEVIRSLIQDLERSGKKLPDDL